eukprot:7454499-Lingulodinium_polyedra.AAC.1
MHGWRLKASVFVVDNDESDSDQDDGYSSSVSSCRADRPLGRAMCIARQHYSVPVVVICYRPVQTSLRMNIVRFRVEERSRNKS